MVAVEAIEPYALGSVRSSSGSLPSAGAVV